MFHGKRCWEPFPVYFPPCNDVLRLSAVAACSTFPKEDQSPCVTILYFQFLLLWTQMKPKYKRDKMGQRKQTNKEHKNITRKIIERSHAHSKNTIKFVFYCIQMRVRKRAEPAGVGGLADWLRTGLTNSRSPSPRCWLLLFAFGRLGLFFLWSEDRVKTRYWTRRSHGVKPLGIT